MVSNAPSTARRIVLVRAGECGNPIPAEVLTTAGVEWLILESRQAVDFLRAEPFTATAVVVAASGESLAALELVASLKSAAARIPIVFLDECNSASSEVRVRRTGVHYYAHIPVSPGEISAVLDGLSAFRTHDSHFAIRPAS